jgi:hypothetical protein
MASSRFTVEDVTGRPSRDVCATRSRSCCAIRGAVISVADFSAPKSRLSFSLICSSWRIERFPFARL